MQKQLFLGTICLATVLIGATFFCFKKTCLANKGQPMTLTSTHFANQGTLPTAYTCDGKNISPDLAWSNAPTGTQSFVLICEDPDAPSKAWVHWVAFNIPASTNAFTENTPKIPTLADGSMQGTNDFSSYGYGGACPPRGHGTHHYVFKLYALSSTLDLQPGATKEDVARAMADKVLGQAQLVGTYSR